MLVLSRRPDEIICIGDDIRVKVVRVQGNKVALGIEAPPEVSVNRAEVERRIAREREAEAPRQQRRPAGVLSRS